MSGSAAAIRRAAPIAVIGIACRFPGCGDLEAFADAIFGGRDCLTRAGGDGDGGPGLVRSSGILPESPLLFDAGYFSISAREAAAMDPQHRLGLEVAVHALESAGLDPDRFPGAIGVFGSVGKNAYEQTLRAATSTSVDETLVELGNGVDYFASRISYKLGLRGVSATVQSACSSGLLGVHLGCRSLEARESDAVVAVASAVRFPAARSYVYEAGGIASRDGYCRAFDHRATGTVAADGVAAVVLKRWEDAAADGDPILAVVRGSAANNDGAKPGFGRVSVEAQVDVLTRAHQAAGVEPASIGYVEAHGTGTLLGDLVELEALERVWGRAVGARRPSLGSVKANIGHTREASGLAGLIRAILCLRHRRLPPQAHFEKLPDEFDEAAYPLLLRREVAEWDAGDLRRAAVSSFGLGGTNVHAVLEEAQPAPAPAPRTGGHEAILVSAASEEAFRRLGAELAAWCTRPDASLGALAVSSQTGRRHLGIRGVVVAADLEAAAESLARLAPRRGKARGRRRVVFLLPGLGDGYEGMAEGLYREFECFRDAFDRCASLLKGDDGIDIGFGGERATAGSTRIAHRVAFAVQHSLAELLRSYGIVPDALVGHSLGEVVAAVLSGAMSLEEGARFVAARADILSRSGAGGMAAVSLAPAEIEAFLGDRLDIAAVNAPRQCVVAGSREEVTSAVDVLRREGVAAAVLDVEHAFHSARLDSAPQLEDAVRATRMTAPAVPYVSGLTGDWVDESLVTSSTYWVRQATQPVRFYECLERAVVDGSIVVELGRGTLTPSVHEMARDAGIAVEILRTLPHAAEDTPDARVLSNAIGRIWASGHPVEWGPGTRESSAAPVPLYPFERAHHGPAAPTEQDERVHGHDRGGAMGARATPSDSLETTVRRLWAEVLGPQPFADDDNFFESGGDSLMGAHILHGLGIALGRDVPSKVLFKDPTIKGMAQSVGAWAAAQ